MPRLHYLHQVRPVQSDLSIKWHPCHIVLSNKLHPYNVIAQQYPYILCLTYLLTPRHPVFVTPVHPVLSLDNKKRLSLS